MAPRLRYGTTRKIFTIFGKTDVPDPEHLISYYIHKQLPQAKCIIIMRNPVKRLYSDYLFFGRFGKRTVEGFHRAAADAVQRFNLCLKTMSTKHCVYSELSIFDLLSRLRIGLYYFYIDHWLNLYPLEQLHWVRLEDYAKDPATVLQGIYDFLGVKEMPKKEINAYITNTTVSLNNAKAYQHIGDMMPQTKQMLTDFYKEYNQKLAERLGDDKLLYED